MKIHRIFAALLVSLVAGVASSSAVAQGAAGYPAKPIRLIVALAPGGPSDILARTLAQKLTEGIRQTVIVDNRPGASGIVGTEIAVRSPSDGYTLLRVSNWFTINPGLFPKLPYDTLRDHLPRHREVDQGDQGNGYTRRVTCSRKQPAN